VLALRAPLSTHVPVVNVPLTTPAVAAVNALGSRVVVTG
jgi:hypothetical protein